MKSINMERRNSGIELLKLIAIFIIIQNHVVQTLTEYLGFYPSNEFVLSLTGYIESPQILLLAMMRFGGGLGNNIFFICSAWFLLDNNKIKKDKVQKMIADVWVISLLLLIIMLIVRKGDIPISLLLKQFMPLTFENNWYITCYLLFYFIHPFLNTIIKSTSQKELFRLSFGMVLLYLVINFILGSHFFTSILIVWISIYFLLAYLKKYCIALMNDRKKNSLVLFLSVFLSALFFILTNYCSKTIGFLQNVLLHWVVLYNPLLILASLSVFNLFRKSSQKNKVINYISGLSLYIYLIHENMLIRYYIRPQIWQFIYSSYGYSNVLLWAMCFSIFIFIFGLFAAMLYKYLFSRFSEHYGRIIFSKLGKIFCKMERKIINNENR